MPVAPGTRLGPYEITAAIGEGGMGEVYRAIDTRLDRTVAIKVLPPDTGDDPERRERFEREARTISRLSHPHICTLHDVGRSGDIDFIVMEFIDGEGLAHRLRAGPLQTDLVLRCGIEIAQALHEAHQAGVIHRDLKPGNVILTRRGIKLLDFGIAKLITPRPTDASGSAPTIVGAHPMTGAGMVIGTLPYMAPEQLEGKDADARTDIFALGGLLYEMATGRRAFSADSQAGVISAIMTAEPVSILEYQPGAPPFLEHLIRKCLAKHPDERWQSALDLAGQLEWIAGKSDTGARAPKSQPTSARAGYSIKYFQSADGASIAAARGGQGPPLVMIPTMVDTIETCWTAYAEAFQGHELITYDRRGTGLSERGSDPGDPEVYLKDAQAVLDGFQLSHFDLLGTLLGTVEAASLASRNPGRARRVVLRSPVIGLADWATIPAVRAALAALDQDWEFFTEAFSQLVVGWGSPKGRVVAARYRTMTTREELRSLLSAFTKLDLMPAYAAIRAPTLVEHHPAYFFPDTYSRSIATMIEGCRMAIYNGPEGDFMTDFTLAREFLAEPPHGD